MSIFLAILRRDCTDLLYDSHSFQLTIQIAYYFLQPMSYNKAVLKKLNRRMFSCHIGYENDLLVVIFKLDSK